MQWCEIHQMITTKQNVAKYCNNTLFSFVVFVLLCYSSVYTKVQSLHNYDAIQAKKTAYYMKL